MIGSAKDLDPFFLSGQLSPDNLLSNIFVQFSEDASSSIALISILTAYVATKNRQDNSSKNSSQSSDLDKLSQSKDLESATSNSNSVLLELLETSEDLDILTSSVNSTISSSIQNQINISTRTI